MDFKRSGQLPFAPPRGDIARLTAPVIPVSPADRDLLLWMLLEPHCGVEYPIPGFVQCRCGELVPDCQVRVDANCLLGTVLAEQLLAGVREHNPLSG